MGALAHHRPIWKCFVQGMCCDFLLSEVGVHGGLSLEAGKRRCVRGGHVGCGSGKPPYWPVQPPCRQACSDFCDTSLFPGGHVPSSQARQGPGRPQGFSA